MRATANPGHLMYKKPFVDIEHRDAHKWLARVSGKNNRQIGFNLIELDFFIVASSPAEFW